MSIKINRVANLMKLDYSYYKKVMLPIIAGFIALNLVMYIMINYINPNGNIQPNFWITWYGLFLFFVGLIFTMSIFPEFKTSDGTVRYQSLPASLLEKYSVRWLYAIFIFPLFITLVMAMCSYFTHGETYFKFHRGGLGLTRLVETFIFFNSLVFMLVAGKGKGRSILEFVSYIGIGIGSMLFISLCAKLIFFKYFTGWNINFSDVNFTDNFFDVIAPKFRKTLDFTGRYLLPILFWVVGYFRFKEKEA